RGPAPRVLLPERPRDEKIKQHGSTREIRLLAARIQLSCNKAGDGSLRVTFDVLLYDKATR
ncbi:MAG: hypothetical protein M3198_07220, partial [Actinomycetota bacterium]|nr:hypothetical protein [Actinomycetota bacterium]